MKKALFLIAVATGMGVAIAQQPPKQEQPQIKGQNAHITKPDINEPAKQQAEPIKAPYTGVKGQQRTLNIPERILKETKSTKVNAPKNIEKNEKR